MTDVDELLRRDARRWNANRPHSRDLDELLPAATAATAATTTTTGPASRRRGSAAHVVAAVLVAVLVAAVTVLVATDGTPPPPPTGKPGTPAVTTRMGELLVQHPPAWHYIAVEQAPMGMGSPLGWLSNEPAHRQCIKPAPNETRCGPPIRALPPGGVYLAAGQVVHLAPPSITLHPTMRISGHDAQLTSSAPPWLSLCPAGTTQHFSLIIDMSLKPTTTTTSSIDYLIACAAHPSPTTTANMQHALTTVRLARGR